MNRSARAVRLLAAALAVAALSIPAASAFAVTVIFTDPNATVTLGVPYGDLEFNNPLSGTEVIAGKPVVEWRDAGFACPGPVYEDWMTSHVCPCPSPAPNTCTDGYVNEIWLRFAGSVATTTTTVPGTSVSVHLHGDANDGVVEVHVDGVHYATVDMYTFPGADNAQIVIDNLPNATHVIEVINMGPGAGGPSADDIALMGAAVLESFFWKGGTTSPMMDIDQKQLAWGDPCPPTGGFQWNWCGPVALANSIWWFDTHTYPGLVPPFLRTATNDVDPVLLVEYLAQLSMGFRPGCDGVGVIELMGIAWEFMRQTAPDAFYFHSIPTKLDSMCAELKRSQDVIILLGFYTSDGVIMLRTGGHFVTLAGCSGTEIAFSDPYWDSHATGYSAGRSNGPHGDPRAAPSDPVNHNDPANYSHDLWTTTVFPGPLLPPGGDYIQVDEYDAEYQQPFDGQNPGFYEELPPPPVQPPGSYTFIDWVISISPNPPDSLATGQTTVPVPGATLAQNYPNPFNPTTTITFTLVETGHVTLRVYDTAGRLVRTLVDGVRAGGREHTATWDGVDRDGRRVASGVYFYRLTTGSEVLTKKMVMLK